MFKKLNFKFQYSYIGSHSEVGMCVQTALVQHWYGPQSELSPHFFIPLPLIFFCSGLLSFLRFEFFMIIQYNKIKALSYSHDPGTLRYSNIQRNKVL